MNRFLGIVRTEYRMAIRRWGVWLAFLVMGMIVILDRVPSRQVLSEGQSLSGPAFWQYVGSIAFDFNILLVVIGGIAIADRVARDRRLVVDELLFSSPVKPWTYILGKYAGSLLSVLTPTFAMVAILGIWDAALRGQPEILPGLLLAFLAINLPAFAFVTAFSLACPAVLPVRVYQVLFTGYWFWGNYLSPEVMPTLNGTLLTASGEFALFGFFGGWVGLEPGQRYTSTEAVLNLVVLGLCAFAALFALERFLVLRDSRA